MLTIIPRLLRQPTTFFESVCKKDFSLRPGQCAKGVAVLVLSLYISACITPSTTAPSAPTPIPLTKVLGKFEPIADTNYLVAPILQTANNSSTYNPLERNNSGGQIHNYIFLNRANGIFQQLLPTNEYVIANRKLLLWPDPQAETPITSGWLYTIIKSDTNDDKALTLADKTTLAISDVGGVMYSEMLTDVDEVYGDTLRDATTLLVVYRSNEQKYLAIIELSQQSMIATTELPSLGLDVE